MGDTKSRVSPKLVHTKTLEMQKPPNYDIKGFAGNKLEAIVPQTLPTNQESRISELLNYISRHQLTNSLEHLEQCGFSGDTGIFILACLQGGVA